jgi:predicted RNA polymerase sigma factor
MMHAYVAGGDVEIVAAADSLIALYPQSALAYQVKGEIAKRAGRRPEASAAMQQALSLLVSGRDTLYLRNVPARDVDRNVQGLTQAVQDLRPR